MKRALAFSWWTFWALAVAAVVSYGAEKIATLPAFAPADAGKVATVTSGGAGVAWQAIPTQTATGAAGGDLALAYPNPHVVGLNGQAISIAPSGFIKRTGDNTAWEAVGYGTASDTVCQGNDTRVVNAVQRTGDTMSGPLTAASGIVMATGALSFTNATSSDPLHNGNGIVVPTGKAQAFGVWTADGNTQLLYIDSSVVYPRLHLGNDGGNYSRVEFDGDSTYLRDGTLLQIGLDGQAAIWRQSGGASTWFFDASVPGNNAVRVRGYYNQTGQSGPDVFRVDSQYYSTAQLPGGVGFGAMNAYAPTGATNVAIDMSFGTNVKIDLTNATSNVTVAIDSLSHGVPVDIPGVRAEIEVKEGSTPRSVTWPSNFKWPGGTAPTFSASTTNLVHCLLDSTSGNYLCRADLDFH